MFRLDTEELFGDFKTIFKDVNTIFNTAMSPHNIYKSGDNVILEIPLAGYPKDDLSVTLEGEILNIKHPGLKAKRKGLIAHNFDAVNMKFKVNGWEVDESKYTDGLLTISFKEKEKSKKVKEIKVD